MIINDINTFVGYIPTAEGTEWPAILPFMQDAEDWVQTSLLGVPLFTAIANMPNTPELNNLSRLLAYKAYSLAIPFVDLIQTPNGFAVVQNTNLVPASQNRVDRLITNTLQRIGYLINTLIGQIEAGATLLTAWAQAPVFEQMTESLFWRPSDMTAYPFFPTPDWNGFSSGMATIIAYTNDLVSTRISPEYVAELIAKRRLGTLTADDKYALRSCQIAVCELMATLPSQADQQLALLTNHMEANPTAYATYIASDTYTIKTLGPYVNQQTDTTYFFNG